jgi:uncharacterized membrane protein
MNLAWFKTNFYKPEIALIGIILLSCLLRLWGITFDSFWLDEAYQSLVDAYGNAMPDLTKMPNAPFIFSFGEIQSVSNLLSNFRNVDPLCPPLYPVLLNRWLLVFGDTDFSVRFLSLLFSTGTIIALFYFTYRIFGFKTAAIAALFESISPFDIYYAQEARMYSLITLMSVLSCFTLITILLSKINKRTLFLCFVLYVLSTWALINTHYTGLFILIFQACLLAGITLLTKNWKIFLSVIMAWLFVAFLWLPWLPMFFQAASIRTAAFYVSREPSMWWPIKALLFEIPINWLEFLSGKKVMVYAIPLYVSSAIFLLLAAISTIKEWQKIVVNNQSLAIVYEKIASLVSDKKVFSANNIVASASNKNILLPVIAIWLWAIIPALTLWLIDTIECHRVIEIARYLTMTAPAIYVLAGIGLARSHLSFKTKAILLSIHICFAFANNIYAHVIPQREPWREMANVVETNCKVDDLILVSQHYDLVCLDRYLTKPYRQIGVSPNMGEKHIHDLLSGLNTFVLITAQEGEQIKNMIPSDFKLNKQIDLSHGLHFRFYSR